MFAIFAKNLRKGNGERFSCFPSEHVVPGILGPASKLAAIVLSGALMGSFVGGGQLHAKPANPMSPGSKGKQESFLRGPSGVFGTLEIPTNAAKGAEKWPDVMKRIEAQRSKLSACKDKTATCSSQVRAWHKGLERLRGLPKSKQITGINRLANRLVRYRDDGRNFGKADYWATPLEALSRGGDCEDFAILKYAGLIELGFKDKSMRLVVLRDNKRRMGHAVLSVDMHGIKHVLDNQFPVPIEHTRLKKRYRPIFSVNSNGQWLALKVRTRNTRVASILRTVPFPQPKPTVKAADEANGLTMPTQDLLRMHWNNLSFVNLPKSSWQSEKATRFTYLNDFEMHRTGMPTL